MYKLVLGIANSSAAKEFIIKITVAILMISFVLAKVNLFAP